MSASYDTAQTPTILTDPDGAVTPWAAGNYTPESGSNRLVVVIIAFGSTAGTAAASAVTLGGQSMTAVTPTATDSGFVSVRAFVLAEAGIAAMSGNALSVTHNDDAVQLAAICFTVTGAAGTTSSPQTGSGSSGTAAPGTGVTSTSDGLVIAGIMSDQEGGITVTSPGADDSGQLKSAPINSDTIAGAQYRAGTGGSVTPQWTQTAAGWAVVAFNIEASGGGGGPAVVSAPAAQMLRPFNMTRGRV